MTEYKKYDPNCIVLANPVDPLFPGGIKLRWYEIPLRNPFSKDKSASAHVFPAALLFALLRDLTFEIFRYIFFFGIMGTRDRHCVICREEGGRRRHNILGRSSQARTTVSLLIFYGEE